jgi:pilus assembly protein Flp/PilA
MNSRNWPGELLTRITSTYLSLREVARRPLDRGLSRREQGQGMVEYALILVLIAVVVLLILTTLGKQVKNVFSNISSAIGT